MRSKLFLAVYLVAVTLLSMIEHERFASWFVRRDYWIAIVACAILLAVMWLMGYRISHRKNPARGRLFQALPRIDRVMKGLCVASIIVMALGLTPLGVFHFSGRFLPADYAIFWGFTMMSAASLVCICALVRFCLWAYNQPFIKNDHSKEVPHAQ